MHATLRFVTCAGLLAPVFGCGGASADHASGHPHAHGGGHAAHHHDFSDVDRFARLFDDPERDAWQRPADVIAMLEIEPGMNVVDLGAGTGYFLRYLSEAAGAGGHVIALDTEPRMVAHMVERAEREQLANVEARVAAPDDPALEAVDRILIVDTWHHLADRERYAAHLARALRPGGFVLVVDFDEASPHGPPPAMRLAAETIVRELEAGGLAAEIVQEALPYQYAVRGRARRGGP
jgi:SAM-dependent methyltransferase